MLGTSALKIYLAGGIAVEAAGEVLLDERPFRSRQEKLTFVYLVCQRGSVTRDQLADVLWPEEKPLAWKTGLSAILSRLKRLLSEAGLDQAGISLASSGQLQLVLPAGAWVDVEEAASALDHAEGALRLGRPADAFGPAIIASSIARRPFLAADSTAWAAQQRARLQRQLVRALECLAQVWLANADPALAVESAAEAASIDPCRESSARLLMLAHAASGNRAEAIRSYHRLRDMLSESLGIGPSAETEAVFLKILD